MVGSTAPRRPLLTLPADLPTVSLVSQNDQTWLDNIVDTDTYPDAPQLPAAADPTEAGKIALQILPTLTRGCADGREIYGNAELNEALNPLRMQPAVGVLCGRTRCRHALGYIALKTQGAAIESGNRLAPKRRRIGGIYDLDHITADDDRWRTFPGWVEDSQAGKGTVRPTGEQPGVGSGFDERREYRCPRCNATFTLTNTQLLKLYVAAISLGNNKIPLNWKP